LAKEKELTKKMSKTIKPTTPEFICPFDKQKFETFDALQTHFKAEHMGKPCGCSTIKLTVNGKNYDVNVEPNKTLWYVLRDKLGLTSPKDMCGGWGACSSCTVLMNGRPILSCMTLAVECDGAAIETSEGIADDNHPLIEAYIRNYAIQCGYCTPGFVVTAKALIDRNPKPTEDDIREALGGNLCKCSSYPAHITAILEAAQELRETKSKKRAS
jgi:aerobic-type carbon monoxide dehydrogenase small subunit (CoxS/CutS family)